MKELLNPLIQSSHQAASGRNTQRIYRKRKKRDCLSSSNIYHTGSVGTIIIDIFIHTRLSLAYAQIHTLKVMLIFTTFWSLIFLWRSVGSSNIHQDSHAPCLSFKSVWKCVWQNILDRNRKCVEHCVSLQVWQEWGWDVNPTGEPYWWNLQDSMKFTKERHQLGSSWPIPMTVMWGGSQRVWGPDPWCNPTPRRNLFSAVNVNLLPAYFHTIISSRV